MKNNSDDRKKSLKILKTNKITNIITNCIRILVSVFKKSDDTEGRYIIVFSIESIENFKNNMLFCKDFIYTLENPL